jgi:hypothetical protein
MPSLVLGIQGYTISRRSLPFARASPQTRRRICSPLTSNSCFMTSSAPREQVPAAHSALMTVLLPQTFRLDAVVSQRVRLGVWRIVRCLARERRFAILSLVAIGACDHSRIEAPRAGPIPSVAAFSRIDAPVKDDAMRELSTLARFIVGALRDSTLRRSVAAAMADTSAGGGIDLQDCRTNALVAHLFESGQRATGTSAAQLCADVSNRDGLILFMAPSRLARWNGTAVPVVSAIASTHDALPPTFLGYRSVERTIMISRDEPLDGPLLMILAMPHARRVRGRTLSLDRFRWSPAPPDSLVVQHKP